MATLEWPRAELPAFAEECRRIQPEEGAMTTPIVHATLEAQKARRGKMRRTRCTMVGPPRLKHIGAATEGRSTSLEGAPEAALGLAAGKAPARRSTPSWWHPESRTGLMPAIEGQKRAVVAVNPLSGLLAPTREIFLTFEKTIVQGLGNKAKNDPRPGQKNEKRRRVRAVADQPRALATLRLFGFTGGRSRQ